MPKQHSMSCEHPEGCSCGASEFNNLERELAGARNALVLSVKRSGDIAKERDEERAANERLRQRFNEQVDYAVTLQRAIEHHCRGVKVPEAIAKNCPYHAELLNL